MERTTATNTHLAGDAALVERARDGDQEAFTKLVDARLSTTYRTALAFLGNEPDAREVTVEIFVRAWRDLPELPAPDGFGAWFAGIVDDSCRRAALDRRRGKVRDLSDGPEGPPTMGTLRGQILARVAATGQRSGPRPTATSIARPSRGPMSRRKRVGIGLPVIVLLSVALVAIIGQRMQPPQTPFKTGLVAFVRDGDVYMANADGTGATRIVHQDGLAMSAVVWSPDGRRVAIDGDAGTILYDTSTGATTHIGGTNPVFSPDGRQIAVMDFDEDAPQLRLQDLVSGTTTRHRIDTIGDLAWSPDGRWIAAAGSDGSRGTEGSTVFVRMDVSSGQVLDADPDTRVRGAVRQPAWSPDSFRVAFSRGTITGYDCRGGSMCDSDVFTADPDGTGVVQLNDPKTVADQPAWSPDGDWIAFRQADSPARQDDSTMDPDANVGLVVISPDLTATRTLDARGVKAFAWSPEGDRLRFVRSEGQGRPATLWEVPFTDEAWADGKAPKARALGLTIDAAVPSYYARRGTGVTWQSLARAADMPSVPSAKPATPAPAVAIATPPAASPADPSASWPTLAIDTTDGCAPPTLVATVDGATTPVGKGCFASDTMQYAWSPTGTQYARLNAAGDLSIMDLDGTVHAKVGGLTGLGGFAWSPGGSWLDVNGPGDRIMRPDGSGLRDLPGSPMWSPDDRRLWVTQPDGTVLVGQGDGSGLTPVGSLPAGPVWSPDGSRIAFIRDGDAWTAAADGTDARNVTSFPLGGANNVLWSPDGRSLAVSSTHGVWVMRADGSDRKALLFGPETQINNQAWSPDSRRLAVETYADSQTGQGITNYLVAADGSTAIKLDALTGAIWSPDGRYLAASHATGSQGGGYEIGNLELMNADGSGRHELPVSANGNWPIWVNTSR